MAGIEAAQCRRSRAWHRAQWRAHVSAQGGSGLSAVDYCREHGLHPKSFYRWKRRLLASEELEGSAVSRAVCGNGRGGPLFIEVVVRGASGGEAALEVVLVRGRRVQVHPGFDEATLARVVAVLERSSC